MEQRGAGRMFLFTAVAGGTARKERLDGGSVPVIGRVAQRGGVIGSGVIRINASFEELLHRPRVAVGRRLEKLAVLWRVNRRWGNFRIRRIVGDRDPAGGGA